MTSQTTTGVGDRGRAPARPPAAALPDVNAETYPFPVVQHLLDRAACFNLLAVGAPQGTHPVPTPGDGWRITAPLHHLEATFAPPPPGHPPQVRQAVGARAAELSCRLVLAAGDVAWAPGHEPAAAAFDPVRPQRFAVLDAAVTFGDGRSGFSFYALGRTRPVDRNGHRSLLAAAVGNLTAGRGSFQGLSATVILDGSLTPGVGFEGLLSCRVVDPRRCLHHRGEVPSSRQILDPDPATTTLILHGEKRDHTQRTEVRFAADGTMDGLLTKAVMRSALHRFTARGPRGVRAVLQRRQVVGALEATIRANLLAPPGTADAPAPFTTSNLYTFFDAEGRPAGSIRAEVEEGRSFGLVLPDAPGQGALRFGGFGRITGGSGCFEGVAGTLTVSSAVGLAPHALSLLNILRLHDPEGRFRAGGRGGAG